MSDGTWSHTDADDCRLRVLRVFPPTAAGAIIADDSPSGDAVGVHVPASEFPAFIAGLYGAAGLPAPVILDRPPIHEDGSPVRYGDFGIKLHKGGVVVGVPGVEMAAIPPGAAYADQADAEPDPAEVQSLADEMRHQVARIGGSPPGEWRIAARTALRWMRERQEREAAP